MLYVLNLHSLSWPPGGDFSGCIEVYTSCVKAALSLLTTRGRLLWLYRSLYHRQILSLCHSLVQIWSLPVRRSVRRQNYPSLVDRIQFTSCPFDLTHWLCLVYFCHSHFNGNLYSEKVPLIFLLTYPWTHTLKTQINCIDVSKYEVIICYYYVWMWWIQSVRGSYMCAASKLTHNRCT